MSEIAPSAMDGAQIDLEEAISAAKGTCPRKTRPILFSGPMVRALIEGRKTQTRPILKAIVPPPPSHDSVRPRNEPKHNAPYLDAYCNARRTPANPRGMSENWCWWTRDDRQCLPTFKVPYAPGDLLWVRETWQAGSSYDGPQVSYQATPDYFEINAWDGPDEGAGPSFNYDKCPGTDFAHWLPDVLSNDGPWRPSIHMPRWASRLTLEVTGVRVERLQEITLADICAEGLARSIYDFAPVQRGFDAFAQLWDGLNANRGFGWEANPWIVAASFRVHHANVDDVLSKIEEAA